MATDFKLPELGENVGSGDVVGVLVSVGDTITTGQGVLELETDKATVEVPSDVAGVVTAIHVKEGDSVQVGQLVLSVAAAAADAPTAPAQDSQPAAQPKPQPAAEPPSEPPPAAAEPPSGPVSVEFRLPDLGENVQSGTVVGLLVSVGDTITKGQGIVELETDKATVEVPADVAGVVTKIHINEGDEGSVGQLVLTVETSGATAPSAKPQPVPAAAEPKPQPAETQPAAKSAPVSAAPKSVPASEPAAASEVLSRHTYQSIGLPVRVDRTLIPAAPNVRRIARELGVNIAEVSGTGPGGRVSMDDVKRHAYRLLRALRAGLPVGTGGGRPSQPLPDFSKWGKIDRHPLSNIRKATARQMDVAWSNIPHVTQFDKADITDLEQMRKQFGAKVEKAGARLTVTAILLKVVASALKEYPQFNASLDMEKEEIIYKNYIHIGVAVDTERGLLVPVVRDVDRKNIIELAVELNEIAEKARKRQLKLDDMQGGTFTITNLGGIGGVNFTPIVNSPEVAILGVARGGMEPVFNKQTGQFEPRLLLPLALSYDHRLIDGADGARFTRYVVQYLEQPFLTALQGW